MQNNDESARSGVWPAIGAPSENDLVKGQAKDRRHEVLMVLVFLGALGLIAAFVCWCMNGGKF